MDYRFTESATCNLKKFPKYVQKRILSKLVFFAKQDNVLLFAKPLTNHKIGSFRFRIGEYRVVFDIRDDEIKILKIGHRRDIYR